MATPAVPVEHTTELALSEKRKLVKSLGHLDMVFFTVCAIVGLDLLGQESVREQVVDVPLAAPAAGD
jgi:hypothetical protein